MNTTFFKTNITFSDTTETVIALSFLFISLALIALFVFSIVIGGGDGALLRILIVFGSLWFLSTTTGQRAFASTVEFFSGKVKIPFFKKRKARDPAGAFTPA